MKRGMQIRYEMNLNSANSLRICLDYEFAANSPRTLQACKFVENSVCKFAVSCVGDACAASAIFFTFVRPISLVSFGVKGLNLADFCFIIKTNYPSFHPPIRGDFAVCPVSPNVQVLCSHFV